MRLVYKYIYKGNKADTERILHYCEVSKNLYNQALYAVKQSLKENKFLFYDDIDKLMKESKNLEGEINYRLMPKAQSAQQCLKVLDKSLKSYFKAVKVWVKCTIPKVWILYYCCKHHFITRTVSRFTIMICAIINCAYNSCTRRNCCPHIYSSRRISHIRSNMETIISIFH